MRRKIVVVCTGVFFIFIICLTFLLNGAMSIVDVLSNSSTLEKAYFVTQIVAAFCVVIGAFIAVWQYVLTTRDIKSKMNTECIQKAIDLSEYYKNNILKSYEMIRYVFDETKMIEVINHIDKKSIKNFDEIELKSLFPESSQKKIKEINESDEFIQAVLQADKIFDMNLNIERNASMLIDKEKKSVTISIDRQAVVRKFMGRIVTDTLNNLEYFAMHFTHGTADESVVYQSLHQTYLEIVYRLYYNIAIINKVDRSKFYTNVIELYEKWNNRFLNDDQKRAESLRTVTTKGNVVDKY